MTEIQGVSPAGTSRPYKSLPEALRAHRIPVENHEFITAIVDAVGVTDLIDRGRYIEAIRRDEGATLHIGRTYTNGFTEDEQVVVGSAPLRLQTSEGRPPYFYAVHPSEFLTAAPTSSRAPRASKAKAASTSAPRVVRASKLDERDYGVCDVCFMVRTASGTCSCS